MLVENRLRFSTTQNIIEPFFTDWYIKQTTGGLTDTNMNYVNVFIDLARSYLGITSAVALVIAFLQGTAFGKNIKKI